MAKNTGSAPIIEPVVPPAEPPAANPYDPQTAMADTALAHEPAEPPADLTAVDAAKAMFFELPIALSISFRLHGQNYFAMRDGDGVIVECRGN